MTADREFPARTRGAGLIAAGFLYDMPRHRTRLHELCLAGGRHRPAFPCPEAVPDHWRRAIAAVIHPASLVRSG